MRDVELLVFEGFEDLAGRMLPGADDGMPRGRVAVHTATDAHGAAHLLIEPIGAPCGAPAGVRKVLGRLDTATNRVLTRRTLFESVLFKIESSETVDKLLHALRPVKTDVANELAPDGHVLAWCDDGGSFARLVRECLSLGCDRIRWAPLGARGAGAVVARIESPPWYLIERWTRADSDAAPIFALASDRFYVRWSHVHPLAGRLRIAENELLFAENDGALKRVPAHEWRDLYDAVAVQIDGLASVRWNAAEPAPRFTVKLRLVATPEPAEPELWLLSKSDLPSVERLLGLMPEADLKHLAIAFFAPGKRASEEDDGPVAALREVITGRGRGWVNFTRTGFRALPGLPNLFLPIDRALDPQVRRDRVADAFALQGGEFMIVREAVAGAVDGAMKAVRIAESGFRPLSTYIDYVVTGDAERLATLVQTSVFDPGPLADLPEAAADPLREREREAAKVLPMASVADGGTPQPVVALETVVIPVTVRPQDAPALAPSSEQQIEGRIASEPPGVAADWMTLAGARMTRGDLDGAVECFENARWMDRTLDAQARARTIVALERQLNVDGLAIAQRPAAALKAGEGEADLRVLRLCALYLEQGTAPAVTVTPAYFESIYTSARNLGERLRKKSRWLIWHAVLSRTGDDIECERQREQILADLNQSGLSPLDRTDFVRARLAERALDGGGDGELQRTMEGLTTRLAKIEDPRLRWTGMALLARRWAELDDIPRARKLAMDAVAGSADISSTAIARILGNAAAALLRIRDPGGPAPFLRAVEMARRLTNGDDRGRTLTAMLESLASVGDVRITTPLVEAALGALEGEDPRRASLTLSRCAPALKKLEATASASQLALKLARDSRVQQDAHYLAGAVAALATLAGPKTVPAAVLNPILDAVRRHMRELEDVQVRLVEGAVALAGEDFAREISDQMRLAQPGEVRFAQLSSWAAAIQGLAAARAADIGLADLDHALKLAWSLPNDDERRRSVRRLTLVVSSFGRVAAGLEIVHEVVRRAEAPGIGPYFRSEVLSACVEVAAKLGARQGAFDVMQRVISLVETTARSSAGDVTFLFDVLGLCVDHAVTLGAPGESAAVIHKVESLVEEWMDESSARYWTPFYRYRALAKCGRGLARLGHEEEGLAILTRILDKSQTVSGLDKIDLLREIVHCLSEIGGAQRLALVDRMLDAFLTEKQMAMGESGGELLSMVLDEVVSPASRVRAEYARFLGADERNIRERVANERVITK